MTSNLWKSPAHDHYISDNVHLRHENNFWTKKYKLKMLTKSQVFSWNGSNEEMDGLLQGGGLSSKLVCIHVSLLKSMKKWTISLEVKPIATFMVMPRTNNLEFEVCTIPARVGRIIISRVLGSHMISEIGLAQKRRWVASGVGIWQQAKICPITISLNMTSFKVSDICPKCS